jgi:putative endonuclease
MKWFVYIARCKDDSLYTGITTNPERREREHNNGTGAKSLRGKVPVRIIYLEEYCSQNDARRREEAIKRWKRVNKLKLIARS